MHAMLCMLRVLCLPAHLRHGEYLVRGGPRRGVGRQQRADELPQVKGVAAGRHAGKGLIISIVTVSTIGDAVRGKTQSSREYLRAGGIQAAGALLNRATCG